jgi:hypothetical protein
MNDARDLSARLSELLRLEHGAMADFLVALADFDRRRLWVELGYPSLFYFLHRELGLSKGAAYYRKTAAELVQRFPEVIPPLRDGRLCITSIVELGKVLTAENRDEVLPQFFHRSKREAREVAVALRPVEAAPRREVVTRVRGVAPAAAPSIDVVLTDDGIVGRERSIPAGGTQVAPTTSALDAGAVMEPRVQPAEQVDANFPLPPASDPSFRDSRDSRDHDSRDHDSRDHDSRDHDSRDHDSCDRDSRERDSRERGSRDARDSAEPLTADLRRLHVTVSRRFLEKLEAARDALSHACPGASAEEILERGLDLVLESQAKRKGVVEKPRRERRPAKPDHLPAEVKRAVWIRDGGRCQWALESGGICGSTKRVEFDHSLPDALGGPPTVKNMRLLCRFHNEYAARLVFGDAWMDRFTRGRPKPSSLSPRLAGGEGRGEGGSEGGGHDRASEPRTGL